MSDDSSVDAIPQEFPSERAGGLYRATLVAGAACAVVIGMLAIIASNGPGSDLLSQFGVPAAITLSGAACAALVTLPLTRRARWANRDRS